MDKRSWVAIEVCVLVLPRHSSLVMKEGEGNISGSDDGKRSQLC